MENLKLNKKFDHLEEVILGKSNRLSEEIKKNVKKNKDKINTKLSDHKKEQKDTDSESSISDSFRTTFLEKFNLPQKDTLFDFDLSENINMDSAFNKAFLNKTKELGCSSTEIDQCSFTGKSKSARQKKNSNEFQSQSSPAMPTTPPEDLNKTFVHGRQYKGPCSPEKCLSLCLLKQLEQQIKLLKNCNNVKNKQLRDQLKLINVLVLHVYDMEKSVKKNDSIKKKFDKCNNENDNLLAQLQNLQNENNELKNTIAREKEALADLENQFQGFLGENKDLKDKFDNARKNAKALNDNMEDERRAHAKHRRESLNEIENLNQDNDNLKNVLAALEAEEKQLRKQIDELNNRVDDLEKENGKLKNAYQDVKRESDNNIKQMIKINDENRKLNDDLDKSKKGRAGPSSCGRTDTDSQTDNPDNDDFCQYYQDNSGTCCKDPKVKRIIIGCRGGPSSNEKCAAYGRKYDVNYCLKKKNGSEEDLEEIADLPQRVPIPSTANKGITQPSNLSPDENSKVLTKIFGADSNKNTINDLQNEISTLKTKLQEAEDMIKSLKKKQSSDGFIEISEKDDENRKSDIRLLRTKIKELESFKELYENKKVVIPECQRSTTEVIGTLNSNTEIDEAFQKLCKTNKCYEKIVQYFKEEMSTMSEQLQSLQELLKITSISSQGESSKLVDAMCQLRRINDRLCEELCTIEKQVILENQINQINEARIHELQHIIGSKNADLGYHDEVITDLRKKLNHQIKENVDLKKTINSINNKMVQLHKDVKLVEVNQERNNQEVRETGSRIDFAKENLDEVKKSMERKKERYEQLKAEFDFQKNLLEQLKIEMARNKNKDINEALYNETYNIQIKLATVEKEKEDLEEKYQDLGQRFKKLLKERETLIVKISELNQFLQEIQYAYHNMEGQYRTLKFLYKKNNSSVISHNAPKSRIDVVSSDHKKHRHSKDSNKDMNRKISEMHDINRVAEKVRENRLKERGENRKTEDGEYSEYNTTIYWVAPKTETETDEVDTEYIHKVQGITAEVNKSNKIWKNTMKE